MQKRIELTQSGLERLQEELKQLKETERPSAVEKLQKARSMGDLSENSAYTSAREHLSVLEGRIMEIEYILKNSTILSVVQEKNAVAIGSIVKIEVNGSSEEVSIVGEYEADPFQKRLSSTSPIGKALMGRKTGDIIEIVTPSGKVTYKILNIR